MSQRRTTWRQQLLIRNRSTMEWVFRRMEPSRRQRLVVEAVRSAESASSLTGRAALRRALAADARLWSTASKTDEIHTAGLYASVAAVADIPGAIVECGVHHGRSLCTLARAAEVHSPQKQVVGFDCFDAFPPASPEDVGPAVGSAGEVYRGLDVPSQSVVASLLDAPADLVAGYFEDTIPGHLPERISLLHVDCDLYSSTRHVLEHALGRVAPGGLVILDEYGEERWPGATVAVDEVTATTGLRPEWDPTVVRHVLRVPIE